MIYVELLWSFFQIGLFSIGGGYAAMPLIQHQVVDLHPWLTMTQFADIMTIAGIQVAGLPGALVATLGCILPSCIIVMALAYLYYRYKGLSMVQGILSGLRPAVVAMITSAGISLLILSLYGAQELPADLSGVDWISMGIFTVAILILRRWKVNPIWIMAGAGAAGVLLYSIL